MTVDLHCSSSARYTSSLWYSSHSTVISSPARSRVFPLGTSSSSPRRTETMRHPAGQDTSPIRLPQAGAPRCTRRVDQHLVPGGGFLRLRPALAQHPVQKLIVYRLGAEQIRRGVGDEGHHGQGQHVGQRSRHFTDEQYAGHWRPHHRREISRHAQNYEILQMYVQPDGGRPSPPHQAARHRAQHQQRQENPARHPRAEAEDGIREPDGQQPQQPP